VRKRNRIFDGVGKRKKKEAKKKGCMRLSEVRNVVQKGTTGEVKREEKGSSLRRGTKQRVTKAQWKGLPARRQGFEEKT